MGERKYSATSRLNTAKTLLMRDLAFDFGYSFRLGFSLLCVATHACHFEEDVFQCDRVRAEFDQIPPLLADRACNIRARIVLRAGGYSADAVAGGFGRGHAGQRLNDGQSRIRRGINADEDRLAAFQFPAKLLGRPLRAGPPVTAGAPVTADP